MKQKLLLKADDNADVDAQLDANDDKDFQQNSVAFCGKDEEGKEKKERREGWDWGGLYTLRTHCTGLLF